MHEIFMPAIQPCACGATGFAENRGRRDVSAGVVLINAGFCLEQFAVERPCSIEIATTRNAVAAQQVSDQIRIPIHPF
jgi:hypothetical protein